MSAIRVLVALADGSEEMEAVTIIDILRRAAFEVLSVSCNGSGSVEILGSRGVRILADRHITQLADDEIFDLIVLPGGVQGSEALRDCAVLIELLREQAQQKRWRAAICAAPALVLATHELLDGAKATCYPSFLDHLPDENRVIKPVVVDSDYRLITGVGPGMSAAFALELIEQLSDKQTAQRVALPMVFADQY